MSLSQEAIERFLWKSGCVERMYIAGNTTMLYQLLGHDTAPLGYAPFLADYLQGELLQIGGVEAITLPGLSAFVGADVIALVARLLEDGVIDETGLLAESYFDSGIDIGGVHITQEVIRCFIYELKKLVCRRMVWVSMLVSLLLCLFTVCSPVIGSYYVNGERIGSNYEQFQIDKAYQEVLDGRVIDEALIREMQEAYAKVPMDKEQYSLTEEYQKYARPFSAIFHYVRLAAGLSGKEVIQWIANRDDLHDKRLEFQEKRWESLGLTEAEKVFWREQEEKLENPVRRSMQERQTN